MVNHQWMTIGANGKSLHIQQERMRRRGGLIERREQKSALRIADVNTGRSCALLLPLQTHGIARWMRVHRNPFHHAAFFLQRIGHGDGCAGRAV